MIDRTQLTKSDAEFYTSIQKDRHNANYSTNSIFMSEIIDDLKKRTILFINKVEHILEK